AVGSWSVSTAGEVSEDEIKQSLAELAPADRALAEVQRYCPVLESQRLGSMGAPVKLMIEGKPVFLCCAACNKKALANRAETVAKVNKLTKIGATLAKLPAEDRAAAEAQRFCAVMAKSPLGSMGAPVKLMIDGQSVFICCEGCRDAALENPRATLAKVKQPSTN
ncbi:MAG TPA: hypothetical protein VHZ24_15360, partial [Pirellulales bacterium]|nr:hypothetical protein [Pirellulales bacterium]